MSERKNGFYWARFEGFPWQVMESIGGELYEVAEEMPVDAVEPLEIGPRIPSPDEQLHTPPVSTRGY